MSIRVRLIILSFVVALLPAIPLTFLVKSLLEKSFAVGLSSTVDEALEGGIVVTREHLDHLQRRFETDVAAITARMDAAVPDMEILGRRLTAAESSVDGFVFRPTGAGTGASHRSTPAKVSARSRMAGSRLRISSLSR